MTPRVMRLIRTIGVWPMASRMVSQIFCTRQLSLGAPGPAGCAAVAHTGSWQAGVG